MEILEEIERKI